MKYTKKQFEEHKNKLKSINNYSAYNLVKFILEILCDYQVKSCSCNIFSEEIEVYSYIDIRPLAKVPNIFKIKGTFTITTELCQT